MNLYTIIHTGLYATPLIIGGYFFDKQPFLMGLLIIFGCILLGVKLNSDIETAKARRRHLGYGDLK